jgi:hypothetical protein
MKLSKEMKALGKETVIQASIMLQENVPVLYRTVGFTEYWGEEKEFPVGFGSLSASLSSITPSGFVALQVLKVKGVHKRRLNGTLGQLCILGLSTTPEGASNLKPIVNDFPIHVVPLEIVNVEDYRRAKYEKEVRKSKVQGKKIRTEEEVLARQKAARERIAARKKVLSFKQGDSTMSEKKRGRGRPQKYPDAMVYRVLKKLPKKDEDAAKVFGVRCGTDKFLMLKEFCNPKHKKTTVLNVRRSMARLAERKARELITPTYLIEQLIESGHIKIGEK